MHPQWYAIGFGQESAPRRPQQVLWGRVRLYHSSGGAFRSVWGPRPRPELRARPRLERGPHSQVPDGQWLSGETADPHRGYQVPGIQVCGGQLCVQAGQDL